MLKMKERSLDTEVLGYAENGDSELDETARARFLNFSSPENKER